MSSIALKITELTRAFGENPVLRGISLELWKGFAITLPGFSAPEAIDPIARTSEAFGCFILRKGVTFQIAAKS
ncbi:MAG: hypothetical protein GY947_13090 [Rhodobacteraceae bacterium]|nr:hypothetical protein [Paracoccaceae bacterium]